jgi:hypothetical protein
LSIITNEHQIHRPDLGSNSREGPNGRAKETSFFHEVEAEGIPVGLEGAFNEGGFEEGWWESGDVRGDGDGGVLLVQTRGR